MFVVLFIFIRIFSINIWGAFESKHACSTGQCFFDVYICFFAFWSVKVHVLKQLHCILLSFVSIAWIFRFFSIRRNSAILSLNTISGLVDGCKNKVCIIIYIVSSLTIPFKLNRLHTMDTCRLASCMYMMCNIYTCLHGL